MTQLKRYCHRYGEPGLLGIGCSPIPVSARTRDGEIQESILKVEGPLMIFLVRVTTAIGNRFLVPHLVDYGYPFDQIRDHAVVAGPLEAMAAIWRAI